MKQEAARRRWPLALATAAIVLVGVRVSLPSLTERALVDLTGGLLEGRLEIGDVDIALLEGVIVLEDVTFVADEDGAELAGAAALALDVDWGALLFGELEAEHFSAREPRLLVAFDREARLNWADVVREDPDDSPAEDFRVRLQEVELGAGSIRLLDESEDALPSLRLLLGAFSLEDFDLERPEPGAPLRWAIGGADASEWSLGIAPESEQAFDFRLTATAGPVEDDGVIPFRLGIARDDGVELDAEGRVEPVPLVARVEARWQGLRSRALLPLFGLAGITVERGHSRGELEATLDLSDVPERGLRLRGAVRHDDLVFEAKGETAVRVEVPSVDAELREAVLPIPLSPTAPPEPFHVHWGRVAVRRPEVAVTLPAEPEPAAEVLPAEPEPAAEVRPAESPAPDVETPEEALPAPPVAGEEPSAAPAAGEDAPPPSPFAVVVDALSVAEGRLVVRDPSESPPFEGEVAVGFEGTEVRWPPVRFGASQLTLRGPDVGRAAVEGSLGEEQGAVKLRATRIDLVRWNPVIEDFSAYSVSRGALTVKSDLELTGTRYEAPTQLTFHGLRATSRGGAFRRTFGMPMGVALQLLADPAGNIRIRVPVEGDVEEGGQLDLTATFVDALREAVRNSLANALSAPVDVAGSVFRRIGEFFVLGIGEAAFAPAESELPIDAQVVLDSAAQLVLRTPGARLALVADIVPDDLEALGLAREAVGFLDGVARLGDAVFGGGTGRQAPAAAREAAQALVQARQDAIVAHLTSVSGLPGPRIVARPWDGKVREGYPRVNLRLQKR